MRKYDVTDEYFKYYKSGGDRYFVKIKAEEEKSMEIRDSIAGKWVREHIENLEKEIIYYFNNNHPELNIISCEFTHYVAEDGTLYNVNIRKEN